MTAMISYKDIANILDKYILYAKEDIKKRPGFVVPKHFSQTLNISEYLSIITGSSKSKKPAYVKLSDETKQFITNILNEYIKNCLTCSTMEKQVELKSVNLVNYSADKVSQDELLAINEFNKHQKIREIYNKYNDKSIIDFMISYNSKFNIQFGNTLKNGTEGVNKYLEIKINDLLKVFKNENQHVLLEFYNIANKFLKIISYQFAEMAIDEPTTKQLSLSIDGASFSQLLRYNNFDTNLLSTIKPIKKVRKTTKKSTEKSGEKSGEKSTEKSGEKSTEKSPESTEKLDNILESLAKGENESASESEAESESENDATESVKAAESAEADDLLKLFSKQDIKV